MRKKLIVLIIVALIALVAVVPALAAGNGNGNGGSGKATATVVLVTAIRVLAAELNNTSPSWATSQLSGAARSPSRCWMAVGLFWKMLMLGII